ncbi:XRE family transcriptional regulator [Oleidesulfovibrio sp.]|uniref:XRE family transcriptional regulator n=1 Tax=Oleidesulfovibrio sp. TaxID=2909707 RepID=UPI003A83BFE1
MTDRDILQEDHRSSRVDNLSTLDNVDGMKEIKITSEALRHWMKAKNLSQVELERLSGVSQNYISQILSGKRLPALNKIQDICKGIGITLAEFFAQEEKTPVDFSIVPKVKARPRAGNGGLETDGDYEGLYSFHTAFLLRRGNPSEMRLFTVAGDSMEPTFAEGDMILVDMSQRDVTTGKVYLVRISDELMVKRAENRPDGLLLKSDNPDYEPIHVPKNETVDAAIHGRIVWSCREH